MVEVVEVVAWVVVVVEGVRALDDERGIERSIGGVVDAIIEADVEHDVFLSALG